MIKQISNWGPWVLAGIGMWLLGRFRLIYTHHNIFLIALMLVSLLVVLLIWHSNNPVESEE